MTKRAGDYPEEDLTARQKHAERVVKEWRTIAADALMLLREREARRDVDPIKQNDPTYPRKVMERTAVAALYDCCELLGRVPPFEVVELVAHLFGLPADGPIFHDEKPETYFRAARYLALHPKASDREVARKIGVNKGTIKNWKNDRQFVGFRSHFTLAHMMGMDDGEYYKWMKRLLDNFDD